MKLLSTLLIASMAGLGVYMARRRILYAIKTAGIVYVVVLFARLLLSAGNMAERWEDMLWPVFFGLIGWLILWWLSSNYERTKRSR